VVTGVLYLGCSTSDVSEWTPQDHHNNDKPNARQVTGTALPGEEDTTLAEVAWRQNCVRCHGMVGRGDGPEGRMLRVRDLTDPAFQAKMSDEELTTVIKRGRNKMPAFEALPDKVVAALVKHVRRLGGRR
jgi:cytochrome c oxidase cbb3-type subunit 3